MSLLISYEPQRIVTTSLSEDKRNLGMLLHDIGIVAGSLSQDGGKVLLVFENDLYFCLVGMLACWLNGLVPVVPPDTRRATLTSLRDQEDVVHVLHDTHSGIEYSVPTLLMSTHPSDSIDLEELAGRLNYLWSSHSAAIEFPGWKASEYSASTKVTSGDLSEELARIRNILSFSSNSLVVSTVPPHHRYSIVWSILKPFVDGGQFVRALQTDEQVTQSRLKFDYLVSHPLYWRRVAHKIPPELTVITSLSPWLESPTFDDKNIWIDVFTTADEGCIAFRRQPNSPWESLAENNVDKAVNRLAVEADRMAKFFQLNDLGLVRCARASLVLAAVECGDTQLSDIQEPLSIEIKKVFGEAVQAIEVSQVPRDSFGRVFEQDIWALFGVNRDGIPRSKSIFFSAVESDEQGYRCQVNVPVDYRWFDGHFSNYPVMPAAIQLEELVVKLLKDLKLLPEKTRLRFERLKFNRRILPGATLQLSIETSKNKPHEFRFSTKEDDRLCSSGRIIIKKIS